MAMQLAALDILITKGGFAPESARAIGEAVDLEIERSHNLLATSQQLTDARLELSTRIDVNKFELLAKIESNKAEVLRWMFVAMTGQTVVLFGLLRMLK